MLLKPGASSGWDASSGAFSTLYRVDAIEALVAAVERCLCPVLSVPSIGSMLLKHGHRCLVLRSAKLSVPSIGSMLLKHIITGRAQHRIATFSTLYRVDAIEAHSGDRQQRGVDDFQYPLSGRCY